MRSLSTHELRTVSAGADTAAKEKDNVVKIKVFPSVTAEFGIRKIFNIFPVIAGVSVSGDTFKIYIPDFELTIKAFFIEILMAIL